MIGLFLVLGGVCQKLGSWGCGENEARGMLNNEVKVKKLKNKKLFLIAVFAVRLTKARSTFNS